MLNEVRHIARGSQHLIPLIVRALIYFAVFCAGAALGILYGVFG
jgi:hypothetical protein